MEVHYVPWPYVIMQIVITLITSASGIIAAVAAARAKRVERETHALAEKQNVLGDKQNALGEKQDVLVEKQNSMGKTQATIHDLVNSQSEKLNDLTGTEQRAAGKLEGVAEEKAAEAMRQSVRRETQPGEGP